MSIICLGASRQMEFRQSDPENVIGSRAKVRAIRARYIGNAAHSTLEAGAVSAAVTRCSDMVGAPTALPYESKAEEAIFGSGQAIAASCLPLAVSGHRKENKLQHRFGRSSRKKTVSPEIDPQTANVHWPCLCACGETPMGDAASFFLTKVSGQSDLWRRFRSEAKLHRPWLQLMSSPLDATQMVAFPRGCVG